MDPVSQLLMASGGLLFKGIGSIIGFGAAQKANEAQISNIHLEQQIEGKKQQAMEMDAHARQLGMLRTQQRVRAMSLTTATSQGAQFGSALPGAYGQSSGETNTNISNLQRNLGFGEDIFGLNSQISQNKVSIAEAGQQSQLGAGLSSFGGDLMSIGNTLGKVQGVTDNRAPG